MAFNTALKLEIPQSPETPDPELFRELVRVYNSLQVIAQEIDLIQLGTAVPAAAVDPATTMALVNALRAVLIAAKIVT